MNKQDITHKYEVVLFKNQERKRTLKKYQTIKKATQFFDNLVKESDSVIFDIQIENGVYSEYEIGIIERNSRKKTDIIKRDSLGKNIIVETSDPNTTLLKLSPYKIPEKIYDVANNKKITIDEFINIHIRKSNELIMLSKLNNRIIHQINEDIKIFTCKSDDDAERFIDTLQNYILLDLNIKNCLFIKDMSTIHRKYLYDILENNGFDRKMLYRKSTTHLKNKQI